MSIQKSKNILKLSNAYKLALGLPKVTINLAGLEPTLWSDIQGRNIVDLIADLRANDFEVEMTSNGSKLTYLYNDLIRAGLSKCRVSIHNFNRETYKKITGKDVLPEVLQGIHNCKGSPLKIVINRVLLKGFTDDIPLGLNFIQEQDISMKLYDLWWVPRIEKYYDEYYIDCKEVINKYVLPITKEVIEMPIAMHRGRFVYKLNSGGQVQMKHFNQSLHDDFENCISCSLKSRCRETFGSYIHIYSNGHLTFCNLREDIHLDLNPFLNIDADEKEIGGFLKFKFDELIGKSWKQRLENSDLRFYINEQCNFKCSFPNDKGGYDSLWCLSSVRTNEIWELERINGIGTLLHA